MHRPKEAAGSHPPLAISLVVLGVNLGVLGANLDVLGINLDAVGIDLGMLIFAQLLSIKVG